MPKFYLTTAIDYSNGDPHLGHALEKVGADHESACPVRPYADAGARSLERAERVEA